MNLKEKLIKKLKSEEEKIKISYTSVVRIIYEEKLSLWPNSYEYEPISNSTPDDTKVIGGGIIDEDFQNVPKHLWREYCMRLFTLFKYQILYRVILEMALFEKKKVDDYEQLCYEQFWLLRLAAEIPILTFKFEKENRERNEILKKIAEERKIDFYKIESKGLYILVKKLDYSVEEKLAESLADFIEGLREWHDNDPFR